MDSPSPANTSPPHTFPHVLDQPSASIVIPTTLRREVTPSVVEQAVASVAEMPAGEVLLVANGPAEGRRRLEFASPRLRVIEGPVGGTAPARNLGLREARNDIVLFTDDDCLVTAEWAGSLTRRLRDGESLVTSPLDVRRLGPITSYLDYQRIFHVRGVDAATANSAISASMGVRRNEIVGGFPDDLTAGEDVEFSARQRDAGIAVAFSTDAPPAIHLLPEAIETITVRFTRYGASPATLFLRMGRPETSIPYATPLYASFCRNELETPRRFEEVADPVVRELFAALDLILTGCILSGYLDEVGKLLGREIIRIDQPGLAAGWSRIHDALRSGFPWDGDWDRLPIDLRRWDTPRETGRPALAAEIAENFARHAPLVEEPGPDPELDRAADQVKRRADEVWAVANAIVEDLKTGRLDPRVDLLDARLRAGGVHFREGMQTMETIALGPVSPATPLRH